MTVMPTHRDQPWLRGEKVVRHRSDPEDPEAAAKLHVARQLKVIDEARQATSAAPPGPLPSPG